MSHLETAYRLGTLHAERDFEAGLKEAAILGGIPSGAPFPGGPPTPVKPAVAPAKPIVATNPAAQAQRQTANAVKPRGSTTPGSTGNAPATPGSNTGSIGSGDSGGSRQGAPG